MQQLQQQQQIIHLAQQQQKIHQQISLPQYHLQTLQLFQNQEKQRELVSTEI